VLLQPPRARGNIWDQPHPSLRGLPQAARLPRRRSGFAHDRIKRLCEIPLRRGCGEPVVNFCLYPGNPTLAHRCRFLKLASFDFPAQVIARVIDPFRGSERFIIDELHIYLANRAVQFFGASRGLAPGASSNCLSQAHIILKEIVRLIFPEVRQPSRRWVASVSRAAELPKAPGNGVSRPDTRADHKLYAAPASRAR
jgi:hypothetical protein